MKKTRREFLRDVGVLGLAVGLGSIGLLGCAGRPPTEQAVEKPAEKIPTTPIKMAVVTFLSGPAAIFGVPAANLAKLLVKQINEKGGILGKRKIDLQVLDESGGTDANVRNLRRLTTQENVDVVIGFISSGDMLAVAPVAEDLGQLTIIFDAGSNRLFEERSYEYVFRTCAHLSVGAVGAARLLENMPEIKTVALINQDYAWGRDNAEIFKLALKRLRPDIEVVAELWPPLFTTDYTTHISALLSAEPDFVFSSLWGGDLVTFIQQAKPQGLFDKSLALFSTGEHAIQDLGKDMPEGIILGARGPHYWKYWIDSNPLNKKFVQDYYNTYKSYPNYPAYHMWQAIMAYVAAVEKAYNILGKYPDVEDIIYAMEGLEIFTPDGYLHIEETHQAREPALFGYTKFVSGYDFAVLDNIKLIPTELVNPPPGVKTKDWIATL